MIVNKYANGNGGGGGTGSTITVDAALSSSSTNPVENRVITNALSEYTTNEYVESRFDSAEAYTDSQVNNLEEALSAAITAATENMATQDYVDTAINEELQGYATEAYVDNAITAATEDLASTQYVDDAIAGIVIPEPPSDYATTGDVANAVEGLASETYVDDAISSATEHMVTTDDLQDYATEQYVDDAVNGLAQAIGTLGMVNDVTESNGTVTVMKTTMQEGQLVTGSTSFDIVTSGDIQNFVTSGDVATAITAATENLASETYVNNAVSSASTEIYEYIDAAILTGATITVDDALSTASTNPVENRVIANKFADYVTKLELTGNTETVELELGERNNNYTYKFAYGIMMPTVASGSMKDTNVDSIKAIRIGDETSSMPMDDGVSLYYFNLNGTNYIPANNTIGSKVSLVQGGSSASASVQYSSITAREMDGYYFIVDLSDMTVLVTNTLPTITTGTPGILDDYVTSGDVEDMIEDVVATAITIDSALSTGSTNPVENRVIANALGNFVQSTSVRTIVKCTQAEYDAMQSHDPNTFYIITGVNS
jgi:hypothetical protein